MVQINLILSLISINKAGIRNQNLKVFLLQNYFNGGFILC